MGAPKIAKTFTKFANKFLAKIFAAVQFSVKTHPAICQCLILCTNIVEGCEIWEV